MAANVAAALRSVGTSVALVDADFRTTNVADVLDLDIETSIHAVLLWTRRRANDDGNL